MATRITARDLVARELTRPLFGMARGGYLGNMLIRAGLVLGGVLSVGACVNAADEFDDFGSRLPDASTVPPIDAMVVSELPDIDGEWYLVAKLAGIAEKTLISFRITFDITPVTANTGTLDYVAYALAVATQEPAGEPFTATGVPVDSSASWTGPFNGVMVAETNPITGSNVTITGMNFGTAVSADFLCGGFTGNAGSFPLAGTTWGAVRITGTELPPPVWRCEDQPTP